MSDASVRVLGHLDVLADQSASGAAVRAYLAGEREHIHAAPLLWVLRQEPRLALITESNLGVTHVAAIDDDGVARYPAYERCEVTDSEWWTFKSRREVKAQLDQIECQPRIVETANTRLCCDDRPDAFEVGVEVAR